MTLNSLTPQEVDHHNQFQREYFESSEKRRMIPHDTPYLRRQVKKMIQFGNLKPADRVLEIGCGMGRYTLILADMGVKVEGLDLSPILLERLKGYAGQRYNIPTHCADIASAEFHENFDAIIGFFALHHIHDLSLCFQAIFGALKKGGSILFVEPNPWNALYYVQILITPHQTWKGERGMLRMRPPVMSRILKDAGFTNIRATQFGFFPPFVTNTRPGMFLENILEKPPFWRPILPFQLFAASRPE